MQCLSYMITIEMPISHLSCFTLQLKFELHKNVVVHLRTVTCVKT